MKKENRLGQQAANTDTRGSDVTPPSYTVQASVWVHHILQFLLSRKI